MSHCNICGSTGSHAIHCPEHETRKLQARVAELEAENARLNAFMPTNCSNLTMRKTKGIFTDAGSTYKPSGFVLTNAEGKKCIVDMSAVRWMDGKEFFSMMHSDSTMAQQLLSAQAEIKRLRDAVINCTEYKLGHPGYEALAQPSDTSALDASVAEKVKEAQIECAAELYRDLRDQVVELTRQHDLAVEALEAMAKDGWLLCGPEGLSDAQKKVCEILATIKESEGK